MRIWDRWMQEGAADRRVRSHPPQCTTSRDDRNIVQHGIVGSLSHISNHSTAYSVCNALSSVFVYHSKPFTAEWSVRKTFIASSTLDHRTTDVFVTNGAMKEGSERQNGNKLSLLTSHASVWNTTMVGFESGSGERMLNSCVTHRHTGPASGIMVWGYHSRTLLVRIAGTLNSQRYISVVLEPVVLPYLQGLPTAIFQQDNARPHVARIVQGFFVNRQIELLPWPARFPDLSPIENMWSMVSERLTQITSQAVTPDQLYQRVEAAWSAVPQEHIQRLFESMPKRVAAVISNNGGYSGY
ncbi:Transposable element Tcb1 transposase, partial [Stegodyphus mimosarum]